MILYIENPKDAGRKLPELISEFSKVSGYETDTQKSVACLYINNKRLEREIKEKSHLLLHHKNKIPRSKLT